jgi:hypothetical protein
MENIKSKIGCEWDFIDLFFTHAKTPSTIYCPSQTIFLHWHSRIWSHLEEKDEMRHKFIFLIENIMLMFCEGCVCVLKTSSLFILDIHVVHLFCDKQIYLLGSLCLRLPMHNKWKRIEMTCVIVCWLRDI